MVVLATVTVVIVNLPAVENKTQSFSIMFSNGGRVQHLVDILIFILGKYPKFKNNLIGLKKGRPWIINVISPKRRQFKKF